MKDDLPYAKLVTTKGIVLDSLLTLLCFMVMIGVLKSHVPVEEALYQWLFGAYGAICLSGVFWMALQCLRLTWADQLRNPKL